ncbi:hypothetical protein M408DRAFT_19712 [Serendipita vermifera MAFF 305830]|uniref:Uncharacterized protein n=1 Tax=Serendipita vermifera MAFF 305830 TaxID=933852 RepID=A0A0C3BMS9_SERVB|nr:hypothetical protein M408DRAFT_19712 [Serendipita vermifera MAFF 305830]
MSPSSGTRPLLTLENLQSLPQATTSLEAFVNEQRRNAALYASEAASSIQEPRTTATMPSKPGRTSGPMTQTSPLLRSRLEMQQESVGASNTDATSRIQKKSHVKALFKGFKHVRQEAEHGYSAATNGAKRPRSPQGAEDEEHSARMTERRERRRARRDIIRPKPISPTNENLVEEGSDVEPASKRRKKLVEHDTEEELEELETELTIKKKRRGKVASGIALMETFTANNVKKSRLTLQARDSDKLFKQARSGKPVKIGTAAGDKENQRPIKVLKPSSLERGSKPKQGPPTPKRKAPQRHPKEPLVSPSRAIVTPVHSESPSCDSPEPRRVEPTNFVKKTDVNIRASTNEIDHDEEEHSYSDSWEIGSQLPSEGSSIRSSKSVNVLRSSDPTKVNDKHIQASPVFSEPVITTMATPWNLDAPGAAFGQFNFTTDLDSSHPLENETHDPAVARDSLAHVQSRFFFPPPVGAPGDSKSAGPVEEESRAVADGINRGSSRDAMLKQSPEIEFADVRQVHEQQAYMSMPLREPSPVNSLDLLLQENDADQALFGYTFITDVRLDHGGERVQEHSMEPMGEYEFYPHTDNQYSFNCSINGGPNVIWDQEGRGHLATHPITEMEDSHNYYHEDAIDNDLVTYYPEEDDAAYYPEEDDAVQAQEHSPWIDNADQEGVNDEYLQDIGQFESPVDMHADVLPFSVGRTLLLGLGNDEHPGRSFERSGSRTQSSSTYGQSVQEIEVRAARQLVHRW